MGDYGFEGAGEFGGSDYQYDMSEYELKMLNKRMAKTKSLDKVIEEDMTEYEIDMMQKRQARMKDVNAKREAERLEREAQEAENNKHIWADHTTATKASISVAMAIKDTSLFQDHLDEEIPGVSWEVFQSNEEFFRTTGLDCPKVSEDEKITLIYGDASWLIFAIPDDDQIAETKAVSALMNYVENSDNRDNIHMSHVLVSTY